jgi:hypothetical protein
VPWNDALPETTGRSLAAPRTSKNYVSRRKSNFCSLYTFGTVNYVNCGYKRNIYVNIVW